MNNNYCPNIIDIEASGFGPTSYPIEIGVINSRGDSYCRLIQPTDKWTYWDPAAEAMHKLSREQLLTSGMPVHQVALELNTLLRGLTVHSDGWVVDKPWLIKLYEAAGMDMLFNISPIENLLNEQQANNWHKHKQAMTKELQLKRHRASTDARIIQQTFVRLRDERQRKVS